MRRLQRLHATWRHRGEPPERSRNEGVAGSSPAVGLALARRFQGSEAALSLFGVNAEPLTGLDFADEALTGRWNADGG